MKKYEKEFIVLDTETSKNERETASWVYSIQFIHCKQCYKHNHLKNWKRVFATEDKPFRDVADFLYYVEKNCKSGCVIWVHNLGFDFSFIDFKMLKLGWKHLDNDEKESNYIYVKKGEPIFCTWETPSSKKIRFRDTLCLTNKTLKTIGKELGLEKLDKDDEYNKIWLPTDNLPENEIKYGFRDVEILEKLIIEMDSQFKDTNKKSKFFQHIPLTSTGIVRRALKTESNRKDYRFNIALKKIKDFNKKDEEQGCKIRLQMGNFLQGGLTTTNLFHKDTFFHANNILKEQEDIAKRHKIKVINIDDKKIKHIDITSSYPFQMMANVFPLNGACKISPDEVGNFPLWYGIIEYKGLKLKKNCGLAYLSGQSNTTKPDLINEPKTTIECGLEGEVTVNGRIISAEKYCGRFTCIDVELTERYYDFTEKRILFAWGWKKKEIGKLPDYYLKYVVQLFERKAELKRNKNRTNEEEQEYILSKMQLNSTYGMSVQKPTTTEIVYNQNVKYENRYTVQPVKKIKTPSNITLPYWGVFITAYARKYLCDEIDRHENWIYCDTDSIFYIDDGIEPKQPLKEDCICKNLLSDDKIPGEWDFEDDLIQFQALHAKCYLSVANLDNEKPFNYTIAGLSKRFKQGNNMNYSVLFYGQIFEGAKIVHSRMEQGQIIIKNGDYEIRENTYSENFCLYLESL